MAGLAAIREDSQLEQLRFTMVPSKLSEEVFWFLYFFHVSRHRTALLQPVELELDEPDDWEHFLTSPLPQQQVVVIAQDAAGGHPCRCDAPDVQAPVEPQELANRPACHSVVSIEPFDEDDFEDFLNSVSRKSDLVSVVECQAVGRNGAVDSKSQ